MRGESAGQASSIIYRFFKSGQPRLLSVIVVARGS